MAENCETCGRVLDPERGHVAPVCDEGCAEEWQDAPEPEALKGWREALAFLDNPRQHTMDLITDKDLATRLLMALQYTGNAAGVTDDDGNLYVPWLRKYEDGGSALYDGANKALSALAPQVSECAEDNGEYTFGAATVDAKPYQIEGLAQAIHSAGNEYEVYSNPKHGDRFLDASIGSGLDCPYTAVMWFSWTGSADHSIETHIGAFKRSENGLTNPRHRYTVRRCIHIDITLAEAQSMAEGVHREINAARRLDLFGSK
tara:strand:- start:757 stop:1533 length:777 start_codon:yes stop_codon:yes gene_type:complete